MLLFFLNFLTFAVEPVLVCRLRMLYKRLEAVCQASDKSFHSIHSHKGSYQSPFQLKLQFQLK